MYTNKNLKEIHLENKDLCYHYSKEVEEYVEKIEQDDVYTLSIEDIWDIMTYIMYYTNLSESHAFMETINCEMMYTLSNPAIYRMNLEHNGINMDKHNLFIYSSGVLQIYFWLYNLLESCKHINEETKNEFNLKYKKELKNIYGYSISYDKLILKYHNLLINLLKII